MCSLKTVAHKHKKIDFRLSLHGAFNNYVDKMRGGRG